MFRARQILIVGILACAAAAGAIEKPSGGTADRGRSKADFDRNFFADLAIGISEENAPEVDSGLVDVLFGNADGLSDANEQVIDPVVLPHGTPESHDHFGKALTAGDFNGDGYLDLAIGVPGETVNGVQNAGSVHVLYGWFLGLYYLNEQLWHQGIDGMIGNEEYGDAFGMTLAAGDFNGDGYDDLAVGVPHEDVYEVTFAGAVHVIYGSDSGLVIAGNESWYEGLTGGVSEQSDCFGDALAVGDFNRDGYDDLAIGVPYKDIGEVTNSGKVVILYGTSSGLDERAGYNDHWDQDRNLMVDSCEDFDNFGFSLASGDFNNDTYDDLAVGVPQEGINGVEGAGAVAVLYGSSDGITVTNNGIYHEGYPYYQVDAKFGYALATGDFNGDDYDDLAVGVPYRDQTNTDDSGAVVLLPGSASGTSTWTILIHQGDLENAGIGNEDGDHFGMALAASDFNGDGYDDLAVGAPDEDHSGAVDAGAVFVMYGWSSVPYYLDMNNQLFHQGSGGLEDPPEAGDRLGSSLAAIPLPYLFADGFETGDTSRWSSAVD